MIHRTAPLLLVLLAGSLPAQPATFRAGDGTEIPIQREWAVEKRPADYERVKKELQPYRQDQRYPVLVHTERREGHEPLYYYRDVRWRQENRPAGQECCRRAYFTTAVVDIEKLRAAYFLLVPFAPKWVAGHTALYVETEPGAVRTLDGETTNGFVVSYEAWLRVTQRYKLLGGQLGRYQVIYIVSPWRDFLTRSITFNESQVKRWKLELSSDELRQLALAIGRELARDHSDERYNTLSLSCLTAALDLINQAIPEPRRVHADYLWGLLKNPGYSLPAVADEALREKGLIKSPVETFTTVPPE